jgi:hypothetical protein
MVLNDDERLESTLIGSCLLLCLVVGSLSFLFPSDLAFYCWGAAFLYLGLMLPLIVTLRRPAGRRKLLAAYTAGVAVCIILSTYYTLRFCSLITSLPQELNVGQLPVVELFAAKSSAFRWSDYATWGIVLSTWIDAGVSLTRNDSE